MMPMQSWSVAGLRPELILVLLVIYSDAARLLTAGARNHKREAERIFLYAIVALQLTCCSNHIVCCVF